MTYLIIKSKECNKSTLVAFFGFDMLENYFLSGIPNEYHVSGAKFCFIGFFNSA